MFNKMKYTLSQSGFLQRKTMCYFLSLFFIIQFTLTRNAQTQWYQVLGTPPAGGGITDMLVSGAGFLVVTMSSYNFPNGQMGGIRVSTNNGFSWTAPLNVYTARTLELGPVGSHFALASAWNYPTTNEGLYSSFSDGASWNGPFYTVGPNDNIFSILITTANAMFLGTRNGVLKSTNSGGNFTTANNGIPANSWVWDLDADHNNVIAAATTNGVFISTNLGSSWQQTTGIPSSDTITALEFLPPDTSDNIGGGSRLLMGGNSKVFTAEEIYILAVEAGQLGLGEFVEAIFGHFPLRLSESITQAEIFIASRPKNSQQSGGGIYRSTDRGQTFTQINDGLPNNPVLSSVTGKPGPSSLQLFAGLNNNTMNGGPVYTRTLTVGITPISTEVPEKFSLSQNYPNPFNPNTIIRFKIKDSKLTTLKVIDALGREVATLVNERLQAGTYEVDWDGSDYPSGIYFYELFTDQFVETKKMNLIK